MIHIFSYSTDKTRLRYLTESSSQFNLDISVIENIVWEGFSDKIEGMLRAIDSIPDNEIVCFVDAYDVMANGTEKEILDKFHEFDSDLVISTELNCFPREYTNRFSKSQWSNFHYLNAGGYIGYKFAIQEFLNFKNIDEMKKICMDRGDQTYLMEYYFGNQDKHKISLDYDGRIFLSMFRVNWNDILFFRGRIYNDVLKQYPCFIHFNGSSWETNDGLNIMETCLAKVIASGKISQPLDLSEWKQKLSPLNFPLPQI